MKPYRNTILCGDAATVLRGLPDEVADCVVTSPPYYRQRDYEGEGRQVGLETTPQEYVERLVTVFREMKRVMKPTGTFWLVIGDKYNDGELLGMPWRVALALKDDGWR